MTERTAMTAEEKLRALREQHRRLETAARAVVEDARKAARDGDEAVVATYLLRRLMRELDNEPQPSSFATMSVS
jgi:hypothetical protein